MDERPKWLEALGKAIERTFANADTPPDTPVSIDTIRTEYKELCRRVEIELARVGIDDTDEEWHTTQAIMRTIYKKTKQAYRRGYNTCECLHGPFVHGLLWPEAALSRNVREAVAMWSKTLGWTSVTVTTSRSTAAPLPPKRLNLSSEYRASIRLEGLHTPESDVRWN
jgi:hypothetical protein